MRFIPMDGGCLPHWDEALDESTGIIEAVYFASYLYGGRSPPYNYNTKYTSLPRVFDTPSSHSNFNPNPNSNSNSNLNSKKKFFFFHRPKFLIVSLSSCVTQGRTYGPYFRTSSKSLNGRKIARMAPILTIFGPNRSRRRHLFFEKFSNERRRHRRLVVVSSSPSSSPSSPPSSPQHNYLRS